MASTSRDEPNGFSSLRSKGAVVRAPMLHVLFRGSWKPDPEQETDMPL